MKHRFTKPVMVLVFTLTFLIAGFGGLTATFAETIMVPVNFTKLAKKAKPGVVNIRTGISSASLLKRVIRLKNFSGPLTIKTPSAMRNSAAWARDSLSIRMALLSPITT